MLWKQKPQEARKWASRVKGWPEKWTGLKTATVPQVTVVIEFGLAHPRRSLSGVQPEIVSDGADRLPLRVTSVTSASISMMARTRPHAKAALYPQSARSPRRTGFLNIPRWLSQGSPCACR